MNLNGRIQLRQELPWIMQGMQLGRIQTLRTFKSIVVKLVGLCWILQKIVQQGGSEFKERGPL